MGAELVRVHQDLSGVRVPLTPPDQAEAEATVQLGGGDDPVSDDLVRNEIYSLLQLALQSGPLRGSDPGYFKRASILPEHVEPALEFLRTVVPLTEGLGFSPKQCERVAKWLQDGETQLQKKLGSGN